MSGDEGNAAMDAIEQLKATADIAEIAAVFFNKLCGQGLKREEALQLTQTWLATAIVTALASPPEPDEEPET